MSNAAQQLTDLFSKGFIQTDQAVPPCGGICV